VPVVELVLMGLTVLAVAVATEVSGLEEEVVVLE
jgi:hypothetical protein